MPETTKMQIKIGMPNRPSRPRVIRRISLARAVEIIRQRQYDPGIERELVKMISHHPQNTYERFIGSISRHIEDIHRKSGKQEPKAA